MKNVLQPNDSFLFLVVSSLKLSGVKRDAGLNSPPFFSEGAVVEVAEETHPTSHKVAKVTKSFSCLPDLWREVG